jgi:hypothetical protein
MRREARWPWRRKEQWWPASAKRTTGAAGELGVELSNESDFSTYGVEVLPRKFSGICLMLGGFVLDTMQMLA